jgi:hypothetical protein
MPTGAHRTFTPFIVCVLKPMAMVSRSRPAAALQESSRLIVGRGRKGNWCWLPSPAPPTAARASVTPLMPAKSAESVLLRKIRNS